MESPQDTVQNPSRRRERIIAANVAFVNFCVGVNFGILGPFFPLEAKQKGIDQTTVGIIFGEFEFIIFLVSPIIGYFLPHLGAKFTYASGCFMCSTCNILFGVLAYCPAGTTFAVMTIVTRGLMAFGGAMLSTASFAIIALSFPDNVAGMFGFLETFMGLGFMLGPPLGGAIYQVAGFVFPFAIMGSLMMVAVPVIFFSLDLGSGANIPRSGSLLRLIRNIHVWIAGIMIWSASAVIGFIDPTLQPFLYKNFKLNEFLVGLVFLCGPAIYALLAPLAGYICDRKKIPKELITIGAFFLAFSFLLMGPSPVLGIGPPRLWIIIVFSFPVGVGVAFVIVPATNDVMREAHLMGMEDNFSTFSVASGFLNSALSLGYFCGPVVGGSLTANMSFPWATTYVGFSMLGIAVLMALYTIIFNYMLGGRHRGTTSTVLLSPDETTGLLNNAVRRESDG